MKRALVVLALCTACGTDFRLTDNSQPDGGAGGLGAAGLPCDVQALLADRCQSCHSNPPLDGVPFPLVTYEDLIAQSGGKSIAQRALTRMTSTTNPMPPAPAAPATSTEIAAMQAWINAGLPPGDCTGGSGPFDTAPTCTSGTMWTGGNSESPLMHPGDACIQCHRSGEGPWFTIAGTVYPTAHEPNDCNGSHGGASVQITDANGLVMSLAVNSSGNFFTSALLKFPVTAKVIANGKERVMVATQASGDCNTCHTQTGTSMAPGRIVLP